MQSINRFLYGPTPEDRVREWQAKLRQESRVLDREMRQVRPLTACVQNSGIDSPLQLDTETNKARQTIKQLAKKGDNKSARILAREVVRSDKQKDRLSVSKARLGSIGTQLSQQLGTVNFLLHELLISFRIAMAKVSGSLRKSTEIMKLSNNLIKLPQISQTMREMSMEMTKVGAPAPWLIRAELV
jgi:charged multivesicular body protein 3